MSNNGWAQTHEIIWEPSKGPRTIYRVMVVGRKAYTRTEHKEGAEPFITRKGRRFLFGGRETPQNRAGAVEVTWME